MTRRVPSALRRLSHKTLLSIFWRFNFFHSAEIMYFPLILSYDGGEKCRHRRRFILELLLLFYSSTSYIFPLNLQRQYSKLFENSCWSNQIIYITFLFYFRRLFSFVVNFGNIRLDCVLLDLCMHSIWLWQIHYFICNLIGLKKDWNCLSSLLSKKKTHFSTYCSNYSIKY